MVKEGPGRKTVSYIGFRGDERYFGEDAFNLVRAPIYLGHERVFESTVLLFFFINYIYYFRTFFLLIPSTFPSIWQFLVRMKGQVAIFF